MSSVSKSAASGEACRAMAGAVRALRAPLDHLADLGDLDGDAGHVGVPTSLPGPLLDLLPAAQRERLAASGMAG